MPDNKAPDASGALEDRYNVHGRLPNTARPHAICGVDIVGVDAAKAEIDAPSKVVIVSIN